MTTETMDFPQASRPAPATDVHCDAALSASLATAAGALLAGGAGGANAATPVDPTPASASYYPNATTDAEAARFLLQAQFSANQTEISSVRAAGYASWLQQQMAQPVSTSGWTWLDSQGYGNVQNPANYYDSTAPADYMIWNQLMASPDAVRKRCALALSEFFVVSSSGLDFSWRSHAAAYYWDTLNTHAFGNYRNLLEAITLNVAMGYYLNTKGNKKADGKGSQPDENYAREVMQLFSIGLVLLNADGTPQLTNGSTTDSYTAGDISNLAQVFTGYDVDQSQNVITLIPQTGGGTRKVGNTAFARLPMVQTGNNHSFLAATFLGVTIPANTSASAALKTALDTLFNHPNTAPFFGKQMIQRLVTSNPSPAYVARVASAFVNNGQGVRGDLAAVWQAILLDDEARGPDGLTQPAFGKLREPMVRLVQWARTFFLVSKNGLWKVGDLSNAATQLGQSALRSPSVFNFFRPGYVPPGTSLSAGSVAPEFQLVNESSVGGYLNYMMGVISNGISSGDIRADYNRELAWVTDASTLVQQLNLLMCAGQLSPATQSLMVTALNATAVTAGSSDAAKRNRICAAVLMVMASAEYLIQK
ncbi:MAG: DUF1800 domain-containing protein [Comamonadaceae bacterium]|nr:DUF1800 domain-containing protein [Comamonadaceae bacterium]